MLQFFMNCLILDEDPCLNKVCGEACIMPPPDISDVLLSDFGETVCNSEGICTFDLNSTECDSVILPEPPLPPPGKIRYFQKISNFNLCIDFNEIRHLFL